MSEMSATRSTRWSDTKESGDKFMRFWAGLTVKQRILDGLCILLCLGMIVYDIVCYVNLPKVIPTNYNLSNEATGYGNKTTIFIVLGIGLIVTASLCAILRIPGFYKTINVPWPVPWGREPLLISATKDYLCWFNLCMTSTFAYLNFCIAGQLKPGILVWIPTAALLVLMVLFILKLRRICKK